jgi:hypothetical protein
MFLLAVVALEVAVAGASLLACRAIVGEVVHSSSAKNSLAKSSCRQRLHDLATLSNSFKVSLRIEMLVEGLMSGGVVIADVATKASSFFGSIPNTSGDLMDFTWISCAPVFILVDSVVSTSLRLYRVFACDDDVSSP